MQRGRERFPDVTPRIISDNGPQFVARDLRALIRIGGMTYVKTSLAPQSKGKVERFHRTIKGDGIRTQTPLSLEDAHLIVSDYVEHYNTVRLHSAIGYVTPQARLEGRDQEDLGERDANSKHRESKGSISVALTGTRDPNRLPRNCRVARRVYYAHPSKVNFL